VKLVVGLGNPGRDYASTRHNVGFRIVDRFARKHDVAAFTHRFGGRFAEVPVAVGGGAFVAVGMLWPERFMNRSGEVVFEALRYLRVDDRTEDVIVTFDDVDLPFGGLRVRASGRSAGHRGVESIIQCLGSPRFPRVRFGIGRPPAGCDTTDYVLQDFSDGEARVLDRYIDTAADALESVVVDGVVAAMSRFNRSAPEDD
jgi:PTH1 family peptidyl-tRNA hydrolase